MRMFRGRWMWGIIGAIATAYLVRRSQETGRRGRRTGVINIDDGYRMGKGALRSAARVGRAVVDSTMKAVVKQRD